MPISYNEQLRVFRLDTPHTTLVRNQLVLDLTRKEVRDCVYGQISAVLRSAPISYLKWDMNRPLTDVYSAALPPDRQGEAALYRRQDTGEVHTGAGWMRGGLLLEAVQSDYQSVLVVLEKAGCAG